MDGPTLFIKQLQKSILKEQENLIKFHKYSIIFINLIPIVHIFERYGQELRKWPLFVYFLAAKNCKFYEI